jgi:hypothetical protein
VVIGTEQGLLKFQELVQTKAVRILKNSARPSSFDISGIGANQVRLNFMALVKTWFI